MEYVPSNRRLDIKGSDVHFSSKDYFSQIFHDELLFQVVWEIYETELAFRKHIRDQLKERAYTAEEFEDVVEKEWKGLSYAQLRERLPSVNEHDLSRALDKLLDEGILYPDDEIIEKDGKRLWARTYKVVWGEYFRNLLEIAKGMRYFSKTRIDPKANENAQRFYKRYIEQSV